MSIDLSPLALQITALAGILGSMAVIWRTALKPALHALQSVARTGERLATIAAPDPNDPEGKPAIVNAVAQLARQGWRTEQAILAHDEQDWTVFEAIADAWNADPAHQSTIELPDREELLIGVNREERRRQR